MRERLAALRDDLHESRDDAAPAARARERVVATALALARQPPLTPGAEPGTWVVPALTGSWSRATIGLEHPARPDEQRPITFDHDIARNRTDVVLAHLGHPLVRMALALLRAEVWGTGNHLHRVAARYADAALGAVPVAVAHGRLVITGATGHRLHEQLIFAGLRLAAGRPERLGVEATDAALATGRDQAIAADAARPPRARACRRTPTRCARRCRPARATVPAQLTATLASRARDEQAKVEATLTELAATIRREAFGEHGDQLQLITGLELDAGDRRQVERDVQSLRARLDAIPREIAAEQAAIARRYAEPDVPLVPGRRDAARPRGSAVVGGTRPGPHRGPPRRVAVARRDSGPFLTVPALKRALPDGLEAPPAALRDLRVAHAEWQDDPGLQRRWIRWVLDELLGLGDAVAEATEADPSHRLAEHARHAAPVVRRARPHPRRHARRAARASRRAGHGARSPDPRAGLGREPDRPRRRARARVERRARRSSPTARAGRSCGRARARRPAPAPGAPSCGSRSRSRCARSSRCSAPGASSPCPSRRASPQLLQESAEQAAGGRRPARQPGPPRRRAADRDARPRGPRPPRRAAASTSKAPRSTAARSR